MFSPLKERLTTADLNSLDYFALVGEDQLGPFVISYYPSPRLLRSFPSAAVLKTLRFFRPVVFTRTKYFKFDTGFEMVIS